MKGGICVVGRGCMNDLFLPKRQDSDKLSSLSLSYTVTETQASWERIMGATVYVQVKICCIIYYSYQLAFMSFISFVLSHTPHSLSYKIMIMI